MGIPKESKLRVRGSLGGASVASLFVSYQSKLHRYTNRGTSPISRIHLLNQYYLVVVLLEAATKAGETVHRILFPFSSLFIFITIIVHKI